MPDSYLFGYGSLVNRSAHNFAQAIPAQVTGWRRMWRQTKFRDVPYLTVVPAPGHVIDGLIAAVPNEDWAGLDLREKNYDRLRLPTNDIRHGHARDITVHMYKTNAANDAGADVRHPILLSYLDCVIQGYLQVFGPSGAEDFFATTDGWDTPILNDRQAPIYTRHVQLSDTERAFVDSQLNRLTSVIEQLDQPGAVGKRLRGA